jgi:tRNA U34 5-methylaminomethyl-2-thiouridine-forming methyltransferase MnmC
MPAEVKTSICNSSLWLLLSCFGFRLATTGFCLYGKLAEQFSYLYISFTQKYFFYLMSKASFEIQKTADGSVTVLSGNFGETYHSVNGAITESQHVFINACYKIVDVNPVTVLEIGFGTGLNAFLTLLEAEKEKREVYYSSIELFPIPSDIYKNLYYSDNCLQGKVDEFLLLHQSDWEKEVAITGHFRLTKRNADIAVFDFGLEKYDVVYFDAFSPNIQPELWTKEIFNRIFRSMKSGGVLTTYCAKGEVRRNMQNAGFIVERLSGPPGKREMLRAVKK